MRRSTRLLLSAVLAALACVAGVSAVRAQSAAPAFRVIVNPRNGTAVIERRFLAQAFLKKATTWGDGELIRPADLKADAPARRRFSEDVLGRSVAAVKSYWQQLIFSGRDVPPPELESDEAVIRFVLRHPGAIGYVSGGADLGGARAVGIK